LFKDGLSFTNCGLILVFFALPNGIISQGALANISILRSGKAKAIRFTTLDAICQALDCQPADILQYSESE
jgi:hypothetical protein